MLVERARCGRYTVRPDADRGLDYLEQKLGIFIQGPVQTRRNAALDILTGRVADQRLLPADFGAPHAPSLAPPAVSLPVPPAATWTHPARMPASPWLAASQ